MVFDSLDMVAALALFAACIGAWLLAAPLRSSARAYARFAAMLLAALSAAATLGLGDFAALFLLPLTAAALMVSAMARFARPLPVFAAALALVVALACGLAALLSGFVLLALMPVLFAALAIIAASLNGVAVIPVLAGASLLAGAMAFLEQGAKAGLYLFCAAALVGLVRSERRSALAVQQQRHARAVDAAVGGLH